MKNKFLTILLLLVTSSPLFAKTFTYLNAKTAEQYTCYSDDVYGSCVGRLTKLCNSVGNIGSCYLDAKDTCDDKSPSYMNCVASIFKACESSGYTAGCYTDAKSKCK